MSKIPVLNKDFQLIIPTHERPTLKQQKTWSGLPPELQRQTLIITQKKSEVKKLRSILEHDHVYSINDPSVNGITKKRQWLVENIKSDYLMQLDDDIRFCKRCSPNMRFINEKGSWEVKPKFKKKGISFNESALTMFSMEERLQMWRDFALMVINNGYAHAALGLRAGNNNRKDEVELNGRMLSAFAHHRKTLLKHNVRFDAVKFRGDFHVNLSLLKLGFPNIIDNRLLINPDALGRPGGCSHERSVEALNSEAFKLAKLHKPFVKTVNKTYKNSPDRIEVICYWKKAYESSEKKDRRV